MTNIPPGIYNVKVLRTRKVRNKPFQRIFYEILETGDIVSQIVPRDSYAFLRDRPGKKFRAVRK